ncbi:hypothetical protein [Priestia abyssalis]|uniref:hypothetical protein n=1 Tax=Priestia abyssalis TaxID=1221450 RepID=UPI001F37E9DD|nr:hypothetical protein [Priestia abyssalis]
MTPDNVGISSADENVRSRAAQYFIDLLDWAKELEAKRICLHGDVGKTQGSGDSSKDWEWLVRFKLLNGDKLGVYHVADSNRQGVGDGHSDLKGQVTALHEISYEGPNPFTPAKDRNYLDIVMSCYKESLKQLREWDAVKVNA